MENESTSLLATISRLRADFDPPTYTNSSVHGGVLILFVLLHPWIDQYFVFSIPPIQGNFFNKLSHHPILTNIRFLSSARSFNISRSAHHNGH
ncbi:hypothetical protein EYC80_001251 [Monilinia laxa]|uniref:Uncharacterized protein n=1 Tax=Monilinia laxa TaxID=61186 RepID=A0A5N6K8T9_MONLA|nr:hypothetical protein EYC80_001251 [Monilinia laxa]